jgi:predicted permease
MALVGPAGFTLTGAGEPIRISAARATPSLFQMLGIVPVLGRGFLVEEDAQGRDSVVLLGHELWRSRFASDPNIIGRTIMLDGAPNVIVGVLPEGLGLPKLSYLYGLTIDFERPQLWKPFAVRPAELNPLGSFNFVALARLKTGVSVSQALEDLNAVQADLARRAPQRAEFRAALVPLAGQIVGRSRSGLRLVLAVVTMVLLVACVNITNLLLARGSRRQREFAIRRAAGASRLRLVRQMFVESLVLSAATGLVAVAVAAALTRLIQLYAPVDLPRLEEVQMGARGIVFTMAVTFLSGLLVGVLPAWRLTKIPPVELLRSSSATAANAAGSGRIRSLLVGVEVAVSAVCLIAGALLLSSFVNLLSIDRGFDIERIIAINLTLPSTRYDTREKGSQFLHTLAEQARSVSGVDSVGVADRLPLSGVSNSAIMVEGTNLPRQERPVAAIRAADSGYFRTLGIPIRAGRILEERDAGRRVAVISALAAQRLWPQQDPLGKRFRFGPDDSPFVEVVGVVGDVHAVSLSEDPPLNIYLPIPDYFFNQAALAVRTTSDPGEVSAAIRAIIRKLDPELAVPALRTMEDVVADSVAQRRFQMTLVLLLAAAAVFLAGLGIYGVVSQAVMQRTSEFGIRMALGADPRNIRRQVIRQGLVPVVVGLGGGVIASLGVGWLLRSLLFGLSPTDARSFAGASLFLLSVALLASFIPAWRASRIDPMIALRHE